VHCLRCVRERLSDGAYPLVDLAQRSGEPVDFYLGPKSAINIPFQQAVPKVPWIDAEACIKLQTGGCGICEQACEPGAIDLSQEDEEYEIDVGQMLITTGYQSFDARAMKQYGYGRLRQCALFARIRADAELDGTDRRQSPVQKRPAATCGRDHPLRGVARRESPPLLFARMLHVRVEVRSSGGGADRRPVYQFYIDMRAFGKGYEEFYSRVLNEGSTLIRGKAAEVVPVLKPNGDGGEGHLAHPGGGLARGQVPRDSGRHGRALQRVGAAVRRGECGKRVLAVAQPRRISSLSGIPSSIRSEP
jgi:ferredoxin